MIRRWSKVQKSQSRYHASIQPCRCTQAETGRAVAELEGPAVGKHEASWTTLTSKMSVYWGYRPLLPWRAPRSKLRRFRQWRMMEIRSGPNHHSVDLDMPLIIYELITTSRSRIVWQYKNHCRMHVVIDERGGGLVKRRSCADLVCQHGEMPSYLAGPYRRSVVVSGGRWPLENGRQDFSIVKFLYASEYGLMERF